MAEALTLNTPEIIPQKTTTDYRLVYLGLDLLGQRIEVRLRGTNAETLEYVISGAEALSLMTALNTANLTTQSLQRRVLNYLNTSGRLLGTVTGTPD